MARLEAVSLGLFLVGCAPKSDPAEPAAAPVDEPQAQAQAQAAPEADPAAAAAAAELAARRAAGLPDGVTPLVPGGCATLPPPDVTAIPPAPGPFPWKTPARSPGLTCEGGDWHLQASIKDGDRTVQELAFQAWDLSQRTVIGEWPVGELDDQLEATLVLTADQVGHPCGASPVVMVMHGRVDDHLVPPRGSGLPDGGDISSLGSLGTTDGWRFQSGSHHGDAIWLWLLYPYAGEVRGPWPVPLQDPAQLSPWWTTVDLDDLGLPADSAVAALTSCMGEDLLGVGAR